MEFVSIGTNLSTTGMSTTYILQLEQADAYGNSQYNGRFNLTMAQAFTAMSKATAQDPMAGFRIAALEDFKTKRQADITAVDAFIAKLSGTASSETTSTSTSASQSQA